MYKAIKNSYSSVPAIKKNNIRVTRVFDSQSGQYSVNSNGFLRSDFSELMAREDKLAYAAALSRMQELDASSNLPENATLEDAVRLVRPRWCQSPAEMDRFEQYCIDNALDFYNKLKQNTPEDVKQAVGAAVASSDPASPSGSQS